MNNGNMPAMPMTCHDTAFDFGDLSEVKKGLTIGLTKREYFAAMAMQGQLAGVAAEYLSQGYDAADNQVDIARKAVDYADALLIALEANNE